jgi:anti-anti-sigma regulatory factor
MRRLIERCCGRLHASTSAGWFRHDSGSCSQTGSRRMPVTRVAMTSGSSLEISVALLGKDAVVRLSGPFNVDSSPDLRDRLRAILSTEPLPRTVTVDLAGVPNIETSGIATLIEALRIAAHQQTRFRLQGLGIPGITNTWRRVFKGLILPCANLSRRGIGTDCSIP